MISQGQLREINAPLAGIWLLKGYQDLFGGCPNW
jgi:hypothetical protein